MILIHLIVGLVCGGLIAFPIVMDLAFPEWRTRRSSISKFSK